MTIQEAQEHAARVLRTMYPEPYDHTKIAGEGPAGYYVLARLHADHTRWVRV